MTAVDFAAFVDELATVSGTAIMPFFRTGLVPSDKSRGEATFDPVTEADRASEAVMRQLIKRTFPSHGIIGEEYGDERTDAEFVWVLDPIDGTRAFISGLPLWGTLIGLTRLGKPCYGMMHQPFTRERFFGDGRSASWRGLDSRGKVVERRLHTRSCTGLGQATLMTTHPSLLTPETRVPYARVEDKVRLSRYGGDCYAYCMVAAGHVDLVIESGLNAYDICALVPIVEGAGGVVTDWTGASAANGGSIIASGDRHLHEQALALLNA